MSDDWSKAEVHAIVDDYLSMLAMELRHQSYYVAGYKPLSNYQQLLFDVVAETLPGRPELPTLAQREATRAAETAGAPSDVLSALVAPPHPADPNTARSPAPEYRTRLGVDYLALEARNRSLGLAGERFVAQFEEARLRSLGKPKLAEKIEIISETRGDGAGFDVLSFETSGKERFIEVKTTGFGKETPFFVTRNELSFSIDHSVAFQLYRLFRFRTEPKLFALGGRLDRSCVLDPAQYIARTA